MSKKERKKSTSGIAIKEDGERWSCCCLGFQGEEIKGLNVIELNFELDRKGGMEAVE